MIKDDKGLFCLSQRSGNMYHWYKQSMMESRATTCSYNCIHLSFFLIILTCVDTLKGNWRTAPYSPVNPHRSIESSAFCNVKEFIRLHEDILAHWIHTLWGSNRTNLLENPHSNHLELEHVSSPEGTGIYSALVSYPFLFQIGHL